MTRSMKIALGVAALLVAAICLAVGIHHREQEKARAEAYEAAEALLLRGAYEEAFHAFDGIDESYRNAKALMYYARARLCYNLGDLEDAYNDLRTCRICIHSSADMPAGYAGFCHKVFGEYEAYEEEQERAAEAAYREKIRTGVPFVGMSESDIAHTSLGAPAEKTRHNNEVTGGHVYPATIYDYYQGSRLIFTARCVQGRVTQVWDKRNKASQPRTYSSKSRKSSAPAQEEDDDPYGAKEYRFAEDFYEDHWDDFFDYEDAEDYFIDHTRD